METVIEQKVEARVRTFYTITEADPTKAPDEYQALQDFLTRHPLDVAIPSFRSIRHARYKKLVEAYHAKAKVAEHVFENLAPTVGRSVIAQRLANTTTYTGIINYAALGSNATLPADGDTQLGTETYRQLLSSQTFVNNIAYLSAFVPAGSATGTHFEGGLFIDGTGSADTGQIFSHVIFSPQIVKSALNSLTLDVTITIS